MTPRIPLDYVIGVEEVTLWLWSNSPDPVTVRFTHHEWAKIERKAQQVGRDIEEVIGTLLEEDLENELVDS